MRFPSIGKTNALFVATLPYPPGVRQCRKAAEAAASFHAVTAPSQSELTTLLNRIIRRISRQLTRDGLLVEEAG